MYVVAEAPESPEPGLMSLSRAVPLAVPSLVHSSAPWAGSVALKYARPFAFAIEYRFELVAPGKISLSKLTWIGIALVAATAGLTGAPIRSTKRPATAMTKVRLN